MNNLMCWNLNTTLSISKFFICDIIFFSYFMCFSFFDSSLFLTFKTWKCLKGLVFVFKCIGSRNPTLPWLLCLLHWSVHKLKFIMLARWVWWSCFMFRVSFLWVVYRSMHHFLKNTHTWASFLSPLDTTVWPGVWTLERTL